MTGTCTISDLAPPPYFLCKHLCAVDFLCTSDIDDEGFDSTELREIYARITVQLDGSDGCK